MPIGGDSSTTAKAQGVQDERCVNLLRRWLSGDEAALEEWLGECGPTVDDLSRLLQRKDLELARREVLLLEKDVEIIRLRKKAATIEEDLFVPLAPS